MQIERLEIEGPLLLTPERHGDSRGFFSETFHAARFAAAGVEHVWVQDNHARSSAAGVLRGLHFQTPPHAQAKLVRVARGRIWDVVVDIRAGSPRFGAYCAVELSAENWRQLYVPAGFAHGYATLEPETETLYKTDAYYAPEHEGGIAWDDPDLGIDWPVPPEGPVLSAKDRTHPRLRDYATPFRYPG